jgi:hypothetical protein
LSIDVADAALPLAICVSPDVGDVLDTWRDVCAKLRRQLADRSTTSARRGFRE